MRSIISFRKNRKYACRITYNGWKNERRKFIQVYETNKKSLKFYFLNILIITGKANNTNKIRYQYHSIDSTNTLKASQTVSKNKVKNITDNFVNAISCHFSFCMFPSIQFIKLIISPKGFLVI
jgi:hypothetical protein